MKRLDEEMRKKLETGEIEGNIYCSKNGDYLEETVGGGKFLKELSYMTIHEQDDMFWGWVESNCGTDYDVMYDLLMNQFFMDVDEAKRHIKRIRSYHKERAALKPLTKK